MHTITRQLSDFGIAQPHPDLPPYVAPPTWQDRLQDRLDDIDPDGRIALTLLKLVTNKPLGHLTFNEFDYLTDISWVPIGAPELCKERRRFASRLIENAMSMHLLAVQAGQEKRLSTKEIARRAFDKITTDKIEWPDKLPA